MCATVSGPKFLSLSEHVQGIVKKLRNNLGHPTSETLAKHLSESGAQRSLVEDAEDYLWPAMCRKKTPGSHRTRELERGH